MMPVITQSKRAHRCELVVATHGSRGDVVALPIRGIRLPNACALPMHRICSGRSRERAHRHVQRTLRYDRSPTIYLIRTRFGSPAHEGAPSPRDVAEARSHRRIVALASNAGPPAGVRGRKSELRPRAASTPSSRARVPSSTGRKAP